MVTRRAHNTILLYARYVVLLVRWYTEVANSLRVNRIHEKLLRLLLFVGNQGHAYFVWTPLRKLVSLGHGEREILIIILNKFVLYNVNEVKFLNIFLVKIPGIKIVVAEHYAIRFILEDNIKCIMQLIFPVLTKLRRFQ